MMKNECGHPVTSEESILRCCDCEAGVAKEAEDAAWNAALEAAATATESLDDAADEATRRLAAAFARRIRALKRTT